MTITPASATAEQRTPDLDPAGPLCARSSPAFAQSPGFATDGAMMTANGAFVCPDEPEPEKPRRSRFGPGFDINSLLTKEDCLEAMGELAHEVASIEAQLEEAKQFPEDYRDEQSRLWLISAKAACSHRRALRQRIQSRIAMLNAAEHKARQERHAETMAVYNESTIRKQRRFIKLAEGVLPPDQFRALWDEVERSEAGAP